MKIHLIVAAGPGGVDPFVCDAWGDCCREDDPAEFWSKVEQADLEHGMSRVITIEVPDDTLDRALAEPLVKGEIVEGGS